MWCGGGGVKKVYFRCGWDWECRVVDVVVVDVVEVVDDGCNTQCNLCGERGGGKGAGGGGVKKVYFRCVWHF